MSVPGENIQSWSTTALDNGTADSLIAWPEGQTRSSVNNSARGMMAAHAKDRNLQNGSIVTTGTANAQAFISGVGYTIVPTGLRVMLKIGVSNTGATTLNMDGIGAVVIKNLSGGDLANNDLSIGTYVEFIYNGTNWILLRDPSLVPVQEEEIDDDPIVDFITAIDDRFPAYLFTLIDLVPAVTNAALQIRVSENTGATWKSGPTDYRWGMFGTDSSGNAGPQGLNSASSIPISIANWSTDARFALSGSVRLFGPSSNTAWKKTISETVYITTANLYARHMGFGMYNSATPINGVQFSASNGNIVSGLIRMYGLRG